MFNFQVSFEEPVATLCHQPRLAHAIRPEADFAAELHDNHRLIVLVFSKRGFSVIFMPKATFDIISVSD